MQVARYSSFYQYWNHSMISFSVSVPNALGTISAALDLLVVDSDSPLAAQLDATVAATDTVDIYASNLPVITSVAQAQKIGSIPADGSTYGGQGLVQFASPRARYLYVVPTGGQTTGRTLLVTAQSTNSGVPGAVAWVQGGNTLSATGVLGTNSAHDLTIRANSATRLTFTSAGAVNLTSAAGQPVVESAGTTYSITGGTGLVTTATTGNSFVQALAGNVSLQANSSVFATGGNGVQIAATTGNTVITAGDNITLTATNAGVSLSALNGTASITANSVTATATADASITSLGGDSGVYAPGGAATLQGTFANVQGFSGVTISCAAASASDITLTPSTAGCVALPPVGVAAGNTCEVRFRELLANGVNYTGFKAPDAIAANAMYTLPSADGAAGQVLATSGAGALSWTSPRKASFGADVCLVTQTTPQFVPPGSRTTTSTTANVGVLQETVGTVSTLCVNFIGDAANVGGQTLTFQLLRSVGGAAAAAVAGAVTAAIPTTAGAHSATVSFTGVSVAVGDILTLTAAVGVAPLTAVCTNVVATVK